MPLYRLTCVHESSTKIQNENVRSHARHCDCNSSKKLVCLAIYGSNHKGNCPFDSFSWRSICSREKIELTRPTKRGPYQGRVDVFGVFPDSSVIVIEVDRGDKRWSLQKLIFAATKLHTQAVWIRWSGFVNLYVPPSVTLIDVTKVGEIIKTKRQLNRL